jgi:hypothetical protein
MHGTETLKIEPAKAGQTSTDQIDKQIDVMNAQLTRFDQMIDLLQSSVDTQHKIYRATTG